MKNSLIRYNSEGDALFMHVPPPSPCGIKYLLSKKTNIVIDMVLFWEYKFQGYVDGSVLLYNICDTFKCKSIYYMYDLFSENSTQ